MSANLLLRLAGWFIVSCAAAQTSAPFDYAAFLKGVRVPAGFAIERAVPEGAVRFPMFATFDDRGRLFVAESAGGDLYEELKTQTRRCRISVLEDRDGDGVFETAQVFAEKLVCPMGLAWRDGKLFVADAPDLITLEDTDGDGRADRRSVLLTGFGHTDNGSLHGLTFGPDGWLYFTMGEPDGYRLRRADGSWLEGTSGALLRSRADGSEVEVVARGFENLVEIAFLPAGEIIGTDNWFQLPADGIRDALVHLLPGGLYPYAPDRGTPQPVTGAPLPPLALYPAVAHSGIMRARAAAWGGDLFSAQHNTRKIIRHRLTRSGATFRAADTDFVWTDDPDFHPADVLEAADGSLLIVDTGSWYIHHCPTGAIRTSPAPGGIYRVRAKEKSAPGEASAEETAWALARGNSAASREKLRAQLADADAETVARAARALGRCADREAAPLLLPLLTHTALSVQLAAAEALAECGDESCAAPVFARLAGEADRFLEHALIHALHRRATTKQLTAALDHTSPRVQRAALLLLDQPPRRALAASAVVRHAAAEDAALRETAQTILQRHEEWFAEALPVLRKLLALPTPDAAELTTLGGFARAFSSRPEVAALLAKVAGGGTPAAEEIRLAVLDEIDRKSVV